MLPQAWESSKRKGASTQRAGKRPKRATPNFGVASVKYEIAARLAQAPEQYEHDMHVQLDDLFSRHGFAEHLASVRAKDCTRSVVEVPRAYEEQYMRECVRGEEPCVMGAACECMCIDRAQPFVGTRFVMPDVRQSDNRMCVLCLRKTTHLLYYRVVTQGIQCDALLQRYGNICNRDGEYHPSAMLICPPSGPVHCLPLPVVAHQRNRYSVEVVHGVKHLRQHGVGMQDFHKPPPPLSV